MGDRRAEAILANEEPDEPTRASRQPLGGLAVRPSRFPWWPISIAVQLSTEPWPKGVRISPNDVYLPRNPKLCAALAFHWKFVWNAAGKANASDVPLCQRE
jgi:hypothetical protein